MKLLVICLLILISPLAHAASEDFTARVVGVHDGDSITVLDQGKTQYKIRMAEIDAPESKQDYGSRSKQMLSDLVFGKTVQVSPVDTDRYGRLVAHVYVGNRNINQAMVEQGGAWVYQHYLKTTSLLDAEAKAKESKVGLWGVSREPIAPWEWRNARRKK
ncbi:MAG: thermonuclease family protein [Sphingobacteriales bacterium]|nr:MAG: thermonuclease family protein [Sphingobacteriales bacterium]